MILCCGEALIDMLPRVSERGEDAFAPYPGGAVFNTAIASGRLGVRTGFLCGLSRDLFGERLIAALKASGVDHSLCPRSDRPTTLAFVTLTGGQARYAFYDENTAMRTMRPDDLSALPDSVTALFLGGISLVSEPCGSAFEALCHLAGDRVVMLDPNIRTGFIRNEEAYRARLARMITRADILKVSDEDLAWIHPGLAPVEAIAALRGAGPGLVLITRGVHGAEAHHSGRTLAVPAAPVTVVDTVGAGDTFNAAILAALEKAGVLDRAALRALSNDTLQTAITMATSAAAVTASRAGADPPWAHELDFRHPGLHEPGVS